MFIALTKKSFLEHLIVRWLPLFLKGGDIMNKKDFLILSLVIIIFLLLLLLFMVLIN